MTIKRSSHLYAMMPKSSLQLVCEEDVCQLGCLHALSPLHKQLADGGNDAHMLNNTSSNKKPTAMLLLIVNGLDNIRMHHCLMQALRNAHGIACAYWVLAPNHEAALTQECRWVADAAIAVGHRRYIDYSGRAGRPETGLQ